MKLKKWRVILLVALGFFLVDVVAVFRIGSGEPRYHLRPISSWLAEYGDGPADYHPSPEADHALQQMGAKAVPHLLELLHSTNSYSHYTFIAGFDKRFTAAVWTPPTPVAGERWTAFSSSVRSRFQKITVPASWNHWSAYLAFQALGPAGRSAIPELVKLAQDPGANSSPSNTGEAPPIRFWKDHKYIPVYAAQSSTYQAHGTPVFPVKLSFIYGGLVPQPFLSDGEIAAWSLAAIGAESVPALMGMLTNSNPQIRCRAVMALGMMGKPAEPALPALVKMLEDPDRNTRREAADALGCIGQQPDFVIPALIKIAFNDGDVESAAVLSLGAFGKNATNSIPALMALFDAEYNSRDQTRGQYRIDDVTLALNLISPEVTRKEVIPLLKKRVQEAPSPWIRNMTLETLGKMTNQADLVFPILLQSLNDTDDYTRKSTIYNLGNFGAGATSAIPALLSFSTNPDTNLCRLATNSLDKIEPGWRKRY